MNDDQLRQLLNGQNVRERKDIAQPTFVRVVVLDVIHDPTTLDSTRVQYYIDNFGLTRSEYAGIVPRNTIIGRRILDSSNVANTQTRFFFPFFPPYISFPCSPGEHVWALTSESESTSPDYGYWFCRIPEPWHVDDMNHTHPPRSLDPSFFPGTISKTNGDKAVFEFQNGIISVDPKSSKRYVKEGSEFIVGGPAAYSDLVDRKDQINSNSLIPADSVPRFRKRPGDVSLEGMNNTLIVLGTDRNGPAAEKDSVDYKTSKKTQEKVATYKFPKDDQPFGSIDIVAGRGQTPETGGEPVTNSLNLKELDKSPPTVEKHPKEGDPDLKNDVSRIRVSQKTKTDKNFGLDSFNAQFQIADSVDGDGSIVIKSDKIRLIARKDVEILVNGGDSIDPTKWASVVLKTNGDIVFKPSDTGYIRLGGDDASRGIVCTDTPVTPTNGVVTGPTVKTTAGGQIAGSIDGKPILSTGYGTFSNRVLIK